jgi:hypothetical protein
MQVAVFCILKGELLVALLRLHAKVINRRNCRPDASHGDGQSDEC